MTIPDTFWRVHPDFTGRCRVSWWGSPDVPAEIRSFAWDPTTFGLTSASRILGLAHDHRGNWHYTFCDGLCDAAGTINYNLQWIGGTPPANFRTFFTLGVSAVASTGSYGTTSAGTDPAQNQSSGGSHSYSNARRVYELKGTSANFSVSLSAIASHPKGHGIDVEVLSQLTSGVRWHPHPKFRVTQSEPGNSALSGPNVRDGSEEGTLDIAATWSVLYPRAGGSWLGLAPYTWTQDLYSQPGYSLTGATDEQWSEPNSGQGRLIAGALGSDITSERLSKESSIVSKLIDRADSNNPPIEIKTKIRWHKPVENPVPIGLAYLTYKGISPSSKETLPAGYNTPVLIKYTNPGAYAEISSEVIAAIGMTGAIIGAVHPGIGAAIGTAGIALEEWGPKDEQMGGFMAVYNSRWRNIQGQPRMGLGIDPAGAPENHELEDVMTVYLEYTTQRWDVETYLSTGYGGQGVVTTYRKNPLVQAQGRFKYYDPNVGTPPGGGGGSGTPPNN